MVRALVFDLDGTLADTAGDLIATLNVILHGDGIDPVPVEAARSLVGAGARALIQRGFARAGRTLAPEKLDSLFAAFLSYYNAHIAEHSRLYPGVVAALDSFTRDGWRLGVCTNKFEHSSRLLLAELEVLDRFDFICGQDTFGIGKPDPKPLLETIRALGSQPELAVMVGDSVTDIKTARAARVKVVAVDFGYTDIPVAELGPDVVISHFDRLHDAVAELTPAL